MKQFNNQKAGTKEGHYLSEWCDSISVGDEVIDGGGVLHICTSAYGRKIDGAKPDDKSSGIVIIVEAKKDRTPHKGRRSIVFIRWCGFWERS